jgi:hypothetical protein
MKDHFPFTDYDFYAYLASGAVLLAAIDFANGGANLARTDWSFVQIVVAVALAYVAGQVTATVSAMIFESWLARTVLHPPFAVLIGLCAARQREQWVARLTAAPYYRPLASEIQRLIIERAKRELGTDDISMPEQVFQPAYAVARQTEDTRLRLDDFRNQYGFSRNMAMVASITAIMFAVQDYRSSERAMRIVGRDRYTQSKSASCFGGISYSDSPSITFGWPVTPTVEIPCCSWMVNK